MQKNLLLIFSLMILISCKQNGSSSQTKSDTTTKSTTNKISDIGDIKSNTSNNNTTNNTTSTSSGNWSKEYRDKFIDGCIAKASEKVSASQAFNYCSCMADKVEAKYPNENDVNSKLTNADINTMRIGCLPSDANQNNSNTQTNNNNNNTSQNNSYTPWSSSDQQEFMNSCVSDASNSLGRGKATDYCDCMLKKIMREYPDPNQVGNIPKSQMNSWAAECSK